MKIESLLSNSIEAWADFAPLPGVKIKLAYLGRQELNNIKKDSTTREYNKITKSLMDTIDEDLFIENFAKKVILDWKGLKEKHLLKLIITNSVDENSETDIPYSLENAVTLLKNSPLFDEWVNEVTSSIDSFRSNTERESFKRTTQVSK